MRDDFFNTGGDSTRQDVVYSKCPFAGQSPDNLADLAAICEYAAVEMHAVHKDLDDPLGSEEISKSFFNRGRMISSASGGYPNAPSKPDTLKGRVMEIAHASLRETCSDLWNIVDLDRLQVSHPKLVLDLKEFNKMKSQYARWFAGATKGNLLKARIGKKKSGETIGPMKSLPLKMALSVTVQEKFDTQKMVRLFDTITQELSNLDEIPVCRPQGAAIRNRKTNDGSFKLDGYYANKGSISTAEALFFLKIASNALYDYTKVPLEIGNKVIPGFAGNNNMHVIRALMEEKAVQNFFNRRIFKASRKIKDSLNEDEADYRELIESHPPQQAKDPDGKKFRALVGALKNIKQQPDFELEHSPVS